MVRREIPLHRAHGLWDEEASPGRAPKGLSDQEQPAACGRQRVPAGDGLQHARFVQSGRHDLEGFDPVVSLHVGPSGRVWLYTRRDYLERLAKEDRDDDRTKILLD